MRADLDEQTQLMRALLKRFESREQASTERVSSVTQNLLPRQVSVPSSPSSAADTFPSCSDAYSTPAPPSASSSASTTFLSLNNASPAISVLSSLSALSPNLDPAPSVRNPPVNEVVPQPSSPFLVDLSNPVSTSIRQSAPFLSSAAPETPVSSTLPSPASTSPSAASVSPPSLISTSRTASPPSFHAVSFASSSAATARLAQPHTSSSWYSATPALAASPSQTVMALASPAASTRPSTPSSPLGRPYGELVRDLSLRKAGSRRHDHPVPATCFSITSPASIASTAASPRSSPSFDSPLPWSPSSDTPLSLSVSVASPLAPVTRVSNSTALLATPAPNIKGEPAPTIRSANASDRWRLDDMTRCPSTASTSAADRAAINSDVSRERVHML
ncbi:hypothetical protein CF326_g8851 [Tilletia indica]|nr:hypothetical protein CF326_g8851 [Tilletia indica]